VIQIRTKIASFVASHTSQRSKNFIMIVRRQRLDISAKFILLLLSCNVKNSFKKSWICIVIQITAKSYRLLLITYPTPRKIIIKICLQLFELSCWQTNRQRQKHDLFGGGNDIKTTNI